MEKEVFEKEQAHLTKTYNKLLNIEKDLKEQISALNEKAVDDKNDIRDNIRFDYADIETTMETLAEIEVWNRYIDTYNVESSSLGKRLATVEKLLESPYFAKISIISAGVTTMGALGKCFLLPVTRYESSFDKATS